MSKVNLNDILDEEFENILDTPTFVKTRKKRKFDDGTSLKHTAGRNRKKTKKKKNKTDIEV